MCELHRGGRLTSRTLAAAVSSLVVCAALLMPPCSGQPVSADSLSWVTYLGGIASDDAAGVAMDAEGYIYVTGVTRSAWSNPGDPSPVRPYSSGDDPADACVARLEPDGDLVWYTFLGGGGNDAGAGIAVDSDYVYVTGRSDNYAWSQSGDGTPVRAHSAGSDAFVARLGADDGVLDWHTFLGGGSGDIGCCVAVDAVGNIFVAGTSEAGWTETPERAHSGGTDVFAASLGTNGTMTWHTFLGGSGNECSTSRCGIAVDADGNAFVVGDSPSGWGDDPVLEYSGADDAFVARVEAGDGALIAHTFLGSSDGTDRGYSIAVSNGSVYVAGESDDSWGASPIRAYYSSSDAFAAKLSTGLELTWNTFLGGHDPDSGYAIAVDSAGKVYVAGESGSGWGEPENAYFDRTDIFAVKLSGNGNLIWNTFAGSGNYEGAWAAVACDADILTLVGYSDGIQAPEPVRDLSGGVDGTVLKFATPAAEPELTEGDANLDGATNVIDAMFIAQYTVGLRELDATQLLCADTTDDGLVNVIDAMHVAQFTVDPHGDGGILCKPLWETPADDGMLNPLGL